MVLHTYEIVLGCGNADAELVIDAESEEVARREALKKGMARDFTWNELGGLAGGKVTVESIRDCGEAGSSPRTDSDGCCYIDDPFDDCCYDDFPEYCNDEDTLIECQDDDTDWWL